MFKCVQVTSSLLQIQQINIIRHLHHVSQSENVVQLIFLSTIKDLLGARRQKQSKAVINLLKDQNLMFASFTDFVKSLLTEKSDRHAQSR